MIGELLRGKMTMLIRSLLLPLCLMQLKGVTGTITFTNDRCLVETGAEVELTWKNTEEVDTEIYFGSQAIGTCKWFAGLCPILSQHQALYSASIDKTPTGYDLVILTIKSFTASNCGEYTCQKLSNASVKDTTTVEHALSYGDSCETCGQCSHSRNMSCSKSSICKCNKGYKYKDNVCARPIDQIGKIALGNTAIVVCNITGEFSNPCWDDGSSNVYIDEGQTTFNTATTNSRWSRTNDTENLIITSFEYSDPRTYRCSITTPTNDSYIAIVTVIMDPPVTYVKSKVVAVLTLAVILLMVVCLLYFKVKVVIVWCKVWCKVIKPEDIVLNRRYDSSSAVVPRGGRSTAKAQGENIIIWIILIAIGVIVLVGVGVTGGYYVDDSYGDGNPNPSYPIALISLAFIVPVEVACIYIVYRKCGGFYKLKKDTKRITDDPEHGKPVEKTGAASTGNRITDDPEHGKPVEKTGAASTGNRIQPPLPISVVQQGPRKALTPLDTTAAVGEDREVQKSKKKKKKKDRST